MKRFLCVVLTLVMALSLVACGGGKKEETSSGGDKATTESTGGAEVIKIGVFEPMTGGNASAGELEYEGMQVANKARPTVTINGVEHPVEFVVADNKTDTVEAVTAAASLVSAGCVAAIGGSGSGLCIAAAPTFQEAKLPIVGTTCTNPLVTQDNDYYLRVCYTDVGQGDILAKYATGVLGAKTAAILCDITDTYCIGLAEYFKAGFGEENIIEELHFNTGDQDFSAALTTINASGADVVFLGSQYTEGGLIAKQAEQLGFDMTFLGTDGWDTDVLLDIGGTALDGCAFVTFFDHTVSKSDAIDKYLADFQEHTGGEPRSSYSSVGYDAYNIILDAIEKCNSTDGETLLAALYETEKDCVTGHITFDAEGDAVKDIAYLKSVKDGKWVSGGTADLK